MRPTLIVPLMLLALLPGFVSAADAQTDAAPPGAVRVFLDCNSRFCDFDFFRTEIPWVDYVRDRRDSDLHLLVTTQQTGSGGTEFTVAFLGQRRFPERNQTLRYVSRSTDTEDAVRRGLARVLKAGLAPYVVETPAGERLRIGLEAGEAKKSETAGPARDPWNFWTFTLGANGFANGEDRYNSLNVNTSVVASRITENWKITLSANSRFSESNFKLNDSVTISNPQRNHGARALVVRSLGGRLSAGGRASLTSSTFLNQSLAFRIAPAIEYNLYPYSESTRRQLTVQYSPGANYFDYEQETIFGRAEEARLDQTLIVSAAYTQPWGSINTSLEGAHYLEEPSKNRVELGGGVNLRLMKGLQFRIGGSAARVRDQIYLPAGDLSPAEILLRQRALATGFRYFGSAGISYTFGSIFNNVVNPRFGSSGGGSSCFCF